MLFYGSLCVVAFFPQSSRQVFIYCNFALPIWLSDILASSQEGPQRISNPTPRTHKSDVTSLLWQFRDHGTPGTQDSWHFMPPLHCL